MVAQKPEQTATNPPAAQPGSAGRAPTPLGLTGVLLLLTTATGLVDAACYLGMGHVLVANMTGNVVFLGFALVGAKGFSIAAFLVALAAFLVGAAAIATTSGGLGPNGAMGFGVIALLGAGMGVQNATLRRVTGAAAMLVGALVGGALMVHVGFTATLAVTAGVFAAVTVGFALASG